MDHYLRDVADRKDRLNKQFLDLLKEVGSEKKANPRTAVVIKGNPKFVTDNPAADSFYSGLKDHLGGLGYDVSFDPGEPHTTPPPADLWVGHSRGADRLRFAPPGTRTVPVGSHRPGAVNHPDDLVDLEPGSTPPEAHYVLTPEMLESLTKAVGDDESRRKTAEDLTWVTQAAGLEKPAVYHGTSVADLKALEPRPSRVLGGDSAVFATPDRDTAVSFAAPWRDHQFEHGRVNGQAYMRERAPGEFDRTFGGKKGYIYSLPDEGFASDPRLTRFERINKNPVTPTSTETIDNILEVLNGSKFLMLRHGEKAPWEKKAYGAYHDYGEQTRFDPLYYGQSPTDAADLINRMNRFHQASQAGGFKVRFSGPREGDNGGFVDPAVAMEKLKGATGELEDHPYFPHYYDMEYPRRMQEKDWEGVTHPIRYALDTNLEMPKPPKQPSSVPWLPIAGGVLGGVALSKAVGPQIGEYVNSIFGKQADCAAKVRKAVAKEKGIDLDGVYAYVRKGERGKPEKAWVDFMDWAEDDTTKRLKPIFDEIFGDHVDYYNEAGKPPAEYRQVIPKKEKAASAQPQLAEAKSLSDGRDYRGKLFLLRDMIRKSPADWTVDSDQGHTVGITHKAGWKFHLPKRDVADLFDFRPQPQPPVKQAAGPPIPPRNPFAMPAPVTLPAPNVVLPGRGQVMNALKNRALDSVRSQWGGDAATVAAKGAPPSRTKALFTGATTPPVKPLAHFVHPMLGRHVGKAMTAGGLVGAGVGVHKGLSQMPNRVDAFLRESGVTDQDALNQQWRNLYWLQPKLLYRSVAPGWAGGDTTAVGQAPGDFFKNLYAAAKVEPPKVEAPTPESTVLKGPYAHVPTPVVRMGDEKVVADAAGRTAGHMGKTIMNTKGRDLVNSPSIRDIGGAVDPRFRDRDTAEKIIRGIFSTPPAEKLPEIPMTPSGVRLTEPVPSGVAASATHPLLPHLHQAPNFSPQVDQVKQHLPAAKAFGVGFKDGYGGN